jgi:hypothetical protein
MRLNGILVVLLTAHAPTEFAKIRHTVAQFVFGSVARPPLIVSRPRPRTARLVRDGRFDHIINIIVITGRGGIVIVRSFRRG